MTLAATLGDELGLFWFGLLVDRIMRATCSPVTNGMCMSRTMTSNSGFKLALRGTISKKGPLTQIASDG